MARAPSACDPSQLALFDEPARPATRPVRPPTPPSPPARPRGPGASAVPDAMPDTVADAVPEAHPPGHAGRPAPTGAEPAFVHPRATHQVQLEGQAVAYALRRARRRSIGFVVGHEGLAVSAPKWVSLADIDGALREKARWILRKLHEQGERQRRLQQARVDWRDGTSVPFLGEPVTVVLDPRATGAVLHVAAAAPPGVPPRTLHVGLPTTAGEAQIRDAVQSWLQRQARRVFEERCRHYAPALGVRWTRLSLSSAQTRWGSASASGAIRLNWRLIHFALATIDYVVVHELAHLRHMDHSPRFWDVVRSVVPDYEQRRGGLKDEVLPVFE